MSERYVLDPSILIQAYIVDTDTRRVQTLLGRLRNDPPDELHIPDFCLLECANILWKRVRFHGMPVTQANQAIDDLRDLPLRRHASADFLRRALAIGVAQQIAIYDSVYLAMAEALQTPLISADTKQSSAATARGLTVKPIMDFPPFSTNLE